MAGRCLAMPGDSESLCHRVLHTILETQIEGEHMIMKKPYQFLIALALSFATLFVGIGYAQIIGNFIPEKEIQCSPKHAQLSYE